MILRLTCAAVIVLALPALAQDRAGSDTGAVMRGLDKLSGETVDVEIGIGESQPVFGLDVLLYDCRFPADDPTGDAVAYVSVREDGRAQTIFDGWMMASAPALNAVDHSRYDVWVLSCRLD